MAVFAGENYCPAGCANRICAKAIVKSHALFGDAVKIGGLIDFAAIAAKGVCSVVICHNKYDIWPFFFADSGLTGSGTAWEN
jgi:hypothetical protein